MAKKHYQAKLVGVVQDDSGRWVAAKTHQAEEVEHFWGSIGDKKNYFYVHKPLFDGVEPIIIGNYGKGEPISLQWNTAGYWEPADEIPNKFHVVIKKIVGHIDYWA